MDEQQPCATGAPFLDDPLQGLDVSFDSSWTSEKPIDFGDLDSRSALQHPQGYSQLAPEIGLSDPESFLLDPAVFQQQTLPQYLPDLYDGTKAENRLQAEPAAGTQDHPFSIPKQQPAQQRDGRLIRPVQESSLRINQSSSNPVQGCWTDERARLANGPTNIDVDHLKSISAQRCVQSGPRNNNSNRLTNFTAINQHSPVYDPFPNYSNQQPDMEMYKQYNPQNIAISQPQRSISETFGNQTYSMDSNNASNSGYYGNPQQGFGDVRLSRYQNGANNVDIVPAKQCQIILPSGNEVDDADRNSQTSHSPTQTLKPQRPRKNPKRPWNRINGATRGLNLMSAKMMSYDARKEYPQFYQTADSATRQLARPWGPFKYTKYGELEWGRRFSAEDIKEYLYNHPLHTVDGTTNTRNGRLILWIQVKPAMKDFRYMNPFSSKCRFKGCPSHNNTISKGEYQVCFDEQTWKDEGNDPLVSAGWVHLYCLEEQLDLPRIFRDLLVMADDRDLPLETDQINRLSIGASNTAYEVAQNFIKSCERDVDIQYGPKKGQPYERWFLRALMAAKRDDEPAARLARQPKPTQWPQHLGNIRAENEARASNPTRKRQSKKVAQEGKSDEDKDGGYRKQEEERARLGREIEERNFKSHGDPRSGRNIRYEKMRAYRASEYAKSVMAAQELDYAPGPTSFVYPPDTRSTSTLKRKANSQLGSEDDESAPGSRVCQMRKRPKSNTKGNYAAG
ncbi:MAG: hypothetical protein M1837_005377 [Sclerophora amabilis]|nr:MAG: hypothetical protein M1837_005377 [Sclerophora amabilis]